MACDRNSSIGGREAFFWVKPLAAMPRFALRAATAERMRRWTHSPVKTRDRTRLLKRLAHALLLSNLPVVADLRKLSLLFAVIIYEDFP